MISICVARRFILAIILIRTTRLHGHSLASRCCSAEMPYNLFGLKLTKLLASSFSSSYMYSSISTVYVAIAILLFLDKHFDLHTASTS